MHDSSSTAGNVNCVLAEVPTTYSHQQFAVGETQQELNSGVWFGDGDYEKAFDGSVFTRVDENGSTCKLGMEFKEGYVGQLSQVKYFINYISNRAQYADNLVFEGYNTADATGADVHFLFNVTNSVHEGWNYHTFDPANKPNYRYYRFRGLGNASGPCRIYEVTLSGLEVIQDNNPTYACMPKVIMNGEPSVSSSSAVTFENTKTAKLTAITPRYGSRLGGETITFTGTGLS